MQRKKDMTFDNWLDEVENYGSRLERLLETFPTADPNALVLWLETAYNVGYEEGKKDGSN